MFHTGVAVTISCNPTGTDCYESVQAVSDTESNARDLAVTEAVALGWESLTGTNGVTFHRCPEHYNA